MLYDESAYMLIKIDYYAVGFDILNSILLSFVIIISNVEQK